MARDVRTIWVRQECCEIFDGFIPRFFIWKIVSRDIMRSKIHVPVDARYFPRGGVRDAELDAMKVFCRLVWFCFRL